MLRPNLVVFVCYSIVILCIVLTLALGLVELDKPFIRDYLVWSDIRTKHYDMLSLAEKALLRGEEEIEAPVRSQRIDLWLTSVMFESDDDNILTPEKLEQIFEVEQTILDFEEWPNLCLARSEFDKDCDQFSYISLA